jgi:hypothetical protein
VPKATVGSLGGLDKEGGVVGQSLESPEADFGQLLRVELANFLGQLGKKIEGRL